MHEYYMCIYTYTLSEEERNINIINIWRICVKYIRELIVIFLQLQVWKYAKWKKKKQ